MSDDNGSKKKEIMPDVNTPIAKEKMPDVKTPITKTPITKALVIEYYHRSNIRYDEDSDGHTDSDGEGYGELVLDPNLLTLSVDEIRRLPFEQKRQWVTAKAILANFVSRRGSQRTSPITEVPESSYSTEEEIRMKVGDSDQEVELGYESEEVEKKMNKKKLKKKMKETEKENENEKMGINFDAYKDIPVEVTGSDVPDPINNFTDIDLGLVLNEYIRYRCKCVKPTPIQRHAIPVVMAGRDLMVCAPIGSGKTTVFCFQIICGVSKSLTACRTRMVYPLALILSHTKKRCSEIFVEAKKLCCQTRVKVAAAYEGEPIYKQLRSFCMGVDILVATPGRLTYMIEISRISLRKIKYLALDEVDRMLDKGFEPQIRNIVERLNMPPRGRRQTMLFSATFPTEIERLASDFLSNYIFLSVGRVGSSTDLIIQKVVFVEDMEKQEYLRNLLHAQKANGNLGKNALTLIFVETKRGADSLARWLGRVGFPAIAIHGDKVQIERERALRSFKRGVTPILVATDVASRGLDIPWVAHVINFDLPYDIDSYAHRIGRTGRAGKSGLATAFFNDKNSGIAKALSELMKAAHQEAPHWLNRYGSSKFGGQDFRKGNDNSCGIADYDGASGSDYYAS